MSRTFLILCAALVLPVSGGLRGQQVPVVESRLSNGMNLLLLPRPGEPTVAGGWVAKVGSANERPGMTGIAHLFEHMMFKGTPTLGTTDYKRDLEIIAEQETVREAMRQEEAKLREAYRRGEIDDWQKPENQTELYRELKRRFQALIEEQRKILVKNEFDKVYTAAGATGMNAFTTQDMTGYFIIVPKNRLEFFMWMESERLLHPVFREFYAERDVVYEERRMRTESTPLGRFQEQFDSVFWTSHPYQWPVIGWPSDIAAISKAQADAFYDTFYAPQNITLILVGDLETGEAATLAEKYFGRIPRGVNPVPDVLTMEVPQQMEKRILAEAEANPQVDIYWHTVPFQHPDSYVLTVLGELLSNRTGRLYKGLVLGQQLATSTFAYQDSMRWAGRFNAGGEAREGHTPEAVEQAIYREIDRLKGEPVPERELQKVKNNFAADEYRKLTMNYHILMHLIFNEGKGNWKEINLGGSRVQAVTAEDVQRVARKYFIPENRAVAIYHRKAAPRTEAESKSAEPGGGPPQPAPVGKDGFTPQQRQVLERIEERVKSETNRGRLSESLAGVNRQLAAAPEERRAFLERYRDLLQKRLDALKGGRR